MGWEVNVVNEGRRSQGDTVSHYVGLLLTVRMSLF